MIITKIDTIQQLSKLREDWNAIYQADSCPTIHRSWSWLRGWAECTPYKWHVIGIKQNVHSPYIAFAMFAKDITPNDKTILYIGGHPLSAHTGFICMPDYEVKVIGSISNYLQKQLKWDVFKMNEVFDARLEKILDHFPSTRYKNRKIQSTPCPFISLPSTWDKYLQNRLSRSASKELKYKTRRLERQKGYRLIQTENDNITDQIETLLRLWQLRWGEKPESVLKSLRSIFRFCFKENSLYLITMWLNGTPIAARVGFVDRLNNTFSGFLSGWDKDFYKLSPGKVLFGHSIRFAIENGLTEYDFGRGNSDYKYGLGAKERYNKNNIIVRRNLKSELLQRYSQLKNHITRDS